MRRARLLLAAVAAPSGAAAAGEQCHAIDPSVNDEWCNTNCNHTPPYCPATLCACGAPTPPGPPEPTPPPAPAPTTPGGKMFGAYFANWAQYHATPYGPYTPAQLEPLIPKLTHLFYAFAKINPSSFAIEPVETKDSQYYQQIVQMKQSKNPGMKFVLSIGGWNHFSSIFSDMVGSSANRAAFINSAKQYLPANGFDGIDIDWEYPGSPARTDYVKISCENMKETSDPGGSSNDFANLKTFMAELRAGLGDGVFISMATQAAKEQSSQWDLAGIAESVDVYNIMSYDYSVSDIPGANLTAPNCPLNNPEGISGNAASWSVSTSVNDYLAAGVPAGKIAVGIALYGHTWYTPGFSGSPSLWQKFGVPAAIQGECCGALKSTFGAKYGPGSQQCGTYMVSEIQALNPTVYHEKVTDTKIAYTSDGVWVSYDDKDTAPSKATLVKQKDLAGAFIFDTSMDTLSGSTHTYEVSNAIYDAL